MMNALIVDKKGTGEMNAHNQEEEDHSEWIVDLQAVIMAMVITIKKDIISTNIAHLVPAQVVKVM